MLHCQREGQDGGSKSNQEAMSAMSHNNSDEAQPKFSIQESYSVVSGGSGLRELGAVYKPIVAISICSF